MAKSKSTKATVNTPEEKKFNWNVLSTLLARIIRELDVVILNSKNIADSLMKNYVYEFSWGAEDLFRSSYKIQVLSQLSGILLEKLVEFGVVLKETEKLTIESFVGVERLEDDARDNKPVCRISLLSLAMTVQRTFESFGEFYYKKATNAVNGPLMNSTNQLSNLSSIWTMQEDLKIANMLGTKNNTEYLFSQAYGLMLQKFVKELNEQVDKRQ